MKKTIGFVLALTVILALFSFTTFAETNPQQSKWTQIDENGQYTWEIDGVKATASTWKGAVNMYSTPLSGNSNLIEAVINSAAEIHGGALGIVVKAASDATDAKFYAVIVQIINSDCFRLKIGKITGYDASGYWVEEGAIFQDTAVANRNGSLKLSIELTNNTINANLNGIKLSKKQLILI